jgi:hypothetical protein
MVQIRNGIGGTNLVDEVDVNGQMVEPIWHTNRSSLNASKRLVIFQ